MPAQDGADIEQEVVKAAAAASTLAASERPATAGDVARATTSGANAWRVRLFGCLGMEDCGGNCCLQWTFCAPCVWGSAMAEAQVDPYDLKGCFGAEALCVPNSCVMACCACPCGAMLNAAYTVAVAEKHGIKQAYVNALLKSLFCLCCAMCQVANEVVAAEVRRPPLPPPNAGRPRPQAHRSASDSPVALGGASPRAPRAAPGEADPRRRPCRRVAAATLRAPQKLRFGCNRHVTDM